MWRQRHASNTHQECLLHLHRLAKDLKVPKPWLVGELPNGDGFIATEFIAFGSGGADLGTRLGEGLAALHQAPTGKTAFGFPLDGCCGAAPQLNNVDERQLTFVEFWREFRLGHQLAMAKKNYPADQELQEKGAQLVSRLDELFVSLGQDGVRPCLIHGDLWSGNYAADTDGNPVIFDPAAYYSFDEADLGIARMFGGFPGSFWRAYHDKIPQRPGFDRRAALFELHRVSHRCHAHPGQTT